MTLDHDRVDVEREADDLGRLVVADLDVGGKQGARAAHARRTWRARPPNNVTVISIWKVVRPMNTIQPLGWYASAIRKANTVTTDRRLRTPNADLLAVGVAVGHRGDQRPLHELAVDHAEADADGESTPADRLTVTAEDQEAGDADGRGQDQRPVVVAGGRAQRELVVDLPVGQRGVRHRKYLVTIDRVARTAAAMPSTSPTNRKTCGVESSESRK